MTAPLAPSADEARRWLQEELAKPRYSGARPGLVDRLATAFSDWLDSLRFGGVSGSPALLLVVLLALVIAGLVVLFGIYGLPRLNRRSTRADALFGDDDTRPARDLRASAERAAAEGDFDLAVVETYRALARALSERGLVATSPGTTAHSFAIRAAVVFESRRASILDAARVFDGVRYLDRVAAEDDYVRLRDLDRELEATPVDTRDRSSAGALS